MNTPALTRTTILTLSAAAALLTAGGCAVEDSSMLIVGNSSLAPAPTCAPNANTNTFVSRGVLDVSLGKQYLMYPIIQNQLGNSEDVRIKPAAVGGGGAQGNGLGDVLVEGNTVLLREATVEFELPEGLPLAFPSELTIPVSGSIAPGATYAPSLELVSPELADLLVNQINQRGLQVAMLVRLKFFGTTASGTEIESTEFTYPLDVCFGCLISYNIDSLTTLPDGRRTCDPADLVLNADQEDPDEPTDVCHLGQDAPVDCRVCRTAKASDTVADAECDPQ